MFIYYIEIFKLIYNIYIILLIQKGLILSKAIFIVEKIFLHSENISSTLFVENHMEDFQYFP